MRTDGTSCVCVSEFFCLMQMNFSCMNDVCEDTLTSCGQQINSTFVSFLSLSTAASPHELKLIGGKEKELILIFCFPLCRRKQHHPTFFLAKVYCTRVNTVCTLSSLQFFFMKYSKFSYSKSSLLGMIRSHPQEEERKQAIVDCCKNTQVEN
jgi:hypothetical protein